MNEVTYVRGADGKFYEEIEGPDGTPDYIEAPTGGNYREIGESGRYLRVRDEAEYARQRDLGSHADYFGLGKGVDDRTARQRMKSQAALTRQLEQMAIDRVDPGGSPDVKQITDTEFERMHAEYRDAEARGEGKRCDFQPLSTYQHKLVTKSGKLIRPILKGEVGMVGSTIYVLEGGYGQGLSVDVPAHLVGEVSPGEE